MISPFPTYYISAADEYENIKVLCKLSVSDIFSNFSFCHIDFKGSFWPMLQNVFGVFETVIFY